MHTSKILIRGRWVFSLSKDPLTLDRIIRDCSKKNMLCHLMALTILGLGFDQPILYK